MPVGSRAWQACESGADCCGSRCSQRSRGPRLLREAVATTSAMNLRLVKARRSMIPAELHSCPAQGAETAVSARSGALAALWCLRSDGSAECSGSFAGRRIRQDFRARGSKTPLPQVFRRLFGCFSYRARLSRRLTRREFSMPRLASSTHSLIAKGKRSTDRLASATVVLPWMISMTDAVARLAVKRVMLSSNMP